MGGAEGSLKERREERKAEERDRETAINTAENLGPLSYTAFFLKTQMAVVHHYA